MAMAQGITAMPRSPYFNLSEPNYFITGFGDTSNPETEYANQVKFRIAIRYHVLALPRRELDTGIHIAYRQNSFWHLWENSAPFFDYNYNPQLILYYDSRQHSINPFAPSVRGFIEHESNGQDGPDNRSWNRYGMGVDLGDDQKNPVFGSARVWGTFAVADENADIEDFAGRGEVSVSVQPWVRKRVFVASLGLNTRMRVGGQPFITNWENNLFIGARDRESQIRVLQWLPLTASLMVQYFYGTGENLLTYREKRSELRIGVATVR